ncbi:hypothetical protein PO124_24640 [Bacillus licheniformis]|nr:hypothetical protein [Bacillus licheniformis]
MSSATSQTEQMPYLNSCAIRKAPEQQSCREMRQMERWSSACRIRLEMTFAAVQHARFLVGNAIRRHRVHEQYSGKCKRCSEKADTLNSNWGQNVATTKLIRGDVYGILGNAFGGNDGYVYDHLASPVKSAGMFQSQSANVPPVVILVIVMLSSLLIGYFSHHYQMLRS